MFAVGSIIVTSLLLNVIDGNTVSIGLLRRNAGKPKPSEYGNRPRGVPYARGPFYKTGETFACIDNSKIIPFSQVNDDYCDCPDGSDEPGTSACTNGMFHCLNRGFRAEDIPSSRVNDQICDCCDGSDEWDGAVDCPNVCSELGAKYQEEMRQKAELAKKGFIKRIELMALGEQLKVGKLKTLETLKGEMEEVRKLKSDAQKKMDEKVNLETEAKKKHDEAWEEEKKKLKREYAQILFTAFDSNKDGKVNFEELKMVKEFDENDDETVSDDEIKDIIPDEKEECDFEVFVEKVYDKIVHHFEKTGEIGKEGGEMENEAEEGEIEMEDTANPSEPVETASGLSETTETVPQEELQNEELPHETDIDMRIPRIPNINLNKPAFSEETKAIIKEVEEARKEYGDIDKRYRELDSLIRDAEQYGSNDFGSDMAWAPLKGKCLEMDENEYTYKLCLFEKATQKSKNSPVETDLGTWNGWIDAEPNKYTMQSYAKGTPCWNGPERSTKVFVECGEETHLIEVSEPNKCEYQFTLRSPAACPDPSTLMDQHEEL